MKGGAYLGKNFDPKYKKKYEDNTKFGSKNDSQTKDYKPYVDEKEVYTKDQKPKFLKTNEVKKFVTDLDEANLDNDREAIREIRNNKIAYPDEIESIYIQQNLNNHVDDYTARKISEHVVNELRTDRVHYHYNIMQPAPYGDHSRSSNMYIDITPPSLQGKMNGSDELTFERRLKMDFCKWKFVKRENGEELNMKGAENINNIMSHVDLVNLNSLHDQSMGGNPYLSVYDGMLVYHTKYPSIEKKSSTTPTSNKIRTPKQFDIDIRFYDLSFEEYYGFVGEFGKSKLDIHLELELYNRMNKIVSSGKSQNFTLMSCYFITKNRYINGKNLKLEHIKAVNEKYKNNTDDSGREYHDVLGAVDDLLELYNSNDFGPLDSSDDKDCNSVHNIREEWEQWKKYIADNQNNMKFNTFYEFVKDKINNAKNQDSNNKIESPEQSVEKSLITVTEHNDFPLSQLFSDLYINTDSTLKQHFSGYIRKEILKSILFQIWHIVDILNGHKILINNLNIRDHFYVKKTREEDIQQYWEYVIGGITYYVPNFGFIIKLNSNFSSKQLIEVTGNSFISRHKNRFSFDSTELNKFEKIIEQLKIVVGNSQINTKEIDKFGNVIFKENNKIYKYFSDYLNSNNLEIINAYDYNIGNKSDFEKCKNPNNGELVIKRKGYNEYIWKIWFTGNNTQNLYRLKRDVPSPEHEFRKYGKITGGVVLEKFNY
jgi:hypothetical protein